MTPWMVDHRSEKFITQKKNSWTADSNEELSSANPYLEMQTSSLSLLLKMATPLTATHYLQNSSNSNSKMTTSAKTQHSPSSQTNSQTLTNTPNQLCETNESERGLL